MFGRWGICRYSKFIMMHRRLFFKSMRRWNLLNFAWSESRYLDQGILVFRNCRSVGGRDSDFDRKSSSNYLAVSAVDGIGCILLCGIVEVAFAYAKKFEKYFQQNASKKNTANNFQSIYLGRHSGWSISLFLDPRRISISMISLPPNFTKFDFKSKLKWFFTSCFGF